MPLARIRSTIVPPTSISEFRVINVVLVFYDTYLRGKGLLERMKKSLICFRVVKELPGLVNGGELAKGKNDTCTPFCLIQFLCYEARNGHVFFGGCPHSGHGRVVIAEGSFPEISRTVRLAGRKNNRVGGTWYNRHYEAGQAALLPPGGLARQS